MLRVMVAHQQVPRIATRALQGSTLWVASVEVFFPSV